MANKDRYKPQEVLDALIATRGMKTIAARKLGCSYHTVQKYIDKYPAIREELKAIRESMGDSIETTLLNQALGIRGEDGTWQQEPNITALIFVAKTHPVLRERGYGESSRVEMSGGENPLKIIIEYADSDDIGND